PLADIQILTGVLDLDLSLSVLMALASSSSSRTWVYDIFPSFSGEDVRVTFLSHFLKELDRKLIIAFKDNDIQRSLSLDPELKQAIRNSKIAVVIFSEKYASSSWCLNELLEIVKCREEKYYPLTFPTIPVFYRLDPSHVRKQTGEFGQIFEETCKNKTEQEMIQWSRALTDVANTLGYHSVNWDNEAKLIEEIANDVLEKLLLTTSKDSENFVGIEDHISKLRVLLQLEAEEVRMVGLWGSSGIGKTTIARVLFQRLSRHFQGSIFIDRGFVSKSTDIFNRANPDDYNIKLHLQKIFLSKFLGKKNIEISQLGELAGRLKHQKVLIFIDDLDDQVVLDALVGETQWFGSGSRIIVVTNDKHFLRAHGIDHIYEVCLPSEDLAREMLCRSAFRENSPPEGFEELVVEITRLAGSLPLALNVLGSSLRGRDMDYWIDLLPRLQNGIDGKIEKTLKISYDGLSSEEDKALFRHIACLFNGEEVTYLKLLLADSGLSVNVGLKNLADKSLIHIRWGYVEMHRLLREMGKKVVRLEKPKNREFLEDSQDIIAVLSKGIGTEKVLSISLDIDEIDELYLHKNAFTGMHNLRFLKIYSKLFREVKLQLPENFDYLLPKLKLLHWDDYPMRCMPSKFRPENLVKLRMKDSKLEKLWEGVVALPCLKDMNLWGSQNLIEMPDLSKATNLETLILHDCYSLVKLPSSIPQPNKLEELDISNCRNLETIPTGINLKSLETLFLNGCSRLRTFPQISTNIVMLYLGETSIEEIPSDLHMENLRFENLHSFCLENLKSTKLWERVQPLTLLTAMMSPLLRHLYLSDIPTLVELPSSFQNLHQLYELRIVNCVNLETLPTGIDHQSLWDLNLSGCSRLRTFPDISTNIEYLTLSKTAIEEVPCWIEEFTSLELLEMNGCLHLNQEALFQQETYLGCQLWLSGEEVPSYFTHRTTATSSSSSSLTVPLLSSSLSQPFLRFRACIVFNCDKTLGQTSFCFKGRFWNRFNSSGKAQDFLAKKEFYGMKTSVKGSHLLILEYDISLSRDSDTIADMNYTHVDLQLDFPSEYKVKEWGIRLCSSADNRLGNTDTLPHLFETDEGNTLNEAGEGEECAGEDEVTEPSSKRMRVRTQQSALYVSRFCFHGSFIISITLTLSWRQENECGKLLL
ncbi:unnamed protein product, partial [Brassica rapa]